MSVTSRIARALIVAAAAAALAGCAGGTSSVDVAPAAAPEPAPVQQQPAPPPAPGRATRAAPAPAPPPPAQKAAVTPEEAKGQCWMKYENDRRAKSIDERLKLVEKCVDDTLRNQPPQR